MLELSLHEQGQGEQANYLRTAEEELLDRAARRALRPWSPATPYSGPHGLSPAADAVGCGLCLKRSSLPRISP
jgi:hypothetical protein